MDRMVEFIRRERLYILLAIFVILINLVTALPSDMKAKAKTRRDVLSAVKLDEKAEEVKEDLFARRDKVKKALKENSYLAVLFSMASLLIFSVLLLGVIIDILFISFKLAGKKFEIGTYRLNLVRWGMLDVARVVILFLFFGYIVIIIESVLAGVFPILKNDNFRMILNSSVLDILSVVFILYFTIARYKESLVSLGISLKNLFKNVFYGVIGYIATVPVLIGVLMMIVFIINLTKYVPEKQPVVELFLKEENMTFLVYTSIFASVVGPIIEELFFRAFMYNALKKYIGVVWAALFTSAVFAALHTNVVGFLPIMVLGVLLAYLYEKTGTLVSSITVHIMHNLSMVFFVFLLKQVKV